MYREQLGPDGKTLMYRLPAVGGATPGTPASLDGKAILEPYAGLEVRAPACAAASSFERQWVLAGLVTVTSSRSCCSYWKTWEQLDATLQAWWT